MIQNLFLFKFLLYVAWFVHGQTTIDASFVDYRIHTFYYGWYGTPEVDGKFRNWDHAIIPHWRDTSWNNARNFPGFEYIGANFYPQLGCYSSNDVAIIRKHMALIKEAGIGVLAISWWGKNDFTDKSVKAYLDLAQEFGLKLTFHIEPCYKSVEQFREQLEYLTENYVTHSALFRHKGKPLYYIYDSGKVKHYDWNKLLGKNGTLTLRNTFLDAIFIGHWERRQDGEFLLKSGFDGFYTYYASEGFMYGSTSSNWLKLSRFAKEYNLIFVPCPGPGYVDTRIRPWNTRNTKDREKGTYYERMFMNAIHAEPDFIGITSFNEWHEGTQIEPAVPKSIPDYTYENYGEGVDPKFYIRKTRELVTKFKTIKSSGF